MISQNAKSSFDQLFTRALKGAWGGADNEPCEVTQVNDKSEITESQMVMLTSSSYVFRVFMMIYFQPNALTKEHLAKRNRTAELTDHAFIDAICEGGNMCCGAFNRDLSWQFPHVGLSTPNILDARCATNLEPLNTGHIQHFRIEINHVPFFHASLCVCDYVDLDFSVACDALPSTATSDGELELF
jgi:hypothetical protein